MYYNRDNPGIEGNYKKITKLEDTIFNLKKDIEVFTRYKLDEYIKLCELEISGLRDLIEMLEYKHIICSQCGHILNKEGRIYQQCTGTEADFLCFNLWDTYICNNCGYFTWDKESCRVIDDHRSIVFKLPNYRGTLDGTPKFDEDNKIKKE